eukprot:CAMPEP_0171341856 /NCGR_PEP_ID=MMETSP0878-20121228/12267_1 /TAXON_ID=67004 /ORGANISM="Thalassiosira weissflogii, Strain CCMP1336" /LENGTH=312 /DNA_ID=CAMNT_0011844311 /DNA_START=177 /DNA_END=1115 /DNA_ORIENTATION=-
MFVKSLSSCETFSTDVKMEFQSSSLSTGESSSILITQSETANSAIPNTVGMTIKEGSEPVTKIILLGERHSGTNWITDHLEECFAKDIEVTTQYKRFKHWFQEEDLENVPKNSAVVVYMSRDPYDWVEAMRERPHHAHDHMNLDWRSFVTKPWIGYRGPHDALTMKNNTRSSAACLDRYSFVEIMPCSPEDSKQIHGYGGYKYELNHDGSEKPYSSIVDMRKEKIINHLSVANFEGTKAFLPNQYEDLYRDGTGVLLEKLKELTGLEPRCEGIEGKGVVKHKEVQRDYVKWMNRFVDWGVEGQIGYQRRQLD